MGSTSDFYGGFGFRVQGTVQSLGWLVLGLTKALYNGSCLWGFRALDSWLLLEASAKHAKDRRQTSKHEATF